MKVVLIIMELIARITAVFIPGIILISCNQIVSVTPPDAPPPNGFIFIASYPEGFQIYLNGQERRRATPDSLTWLSNGTYMITLKKNLFRDTSITVNIVEGQKKSAFIDFSKNPSMLGSIFCDCYQEGAQIIIHDSATGKLTPDTLKNVIPGYYEIRYKLKNHLDDSLNVVVNSGNLSSLNMILVDSTLWQDYTTNNSSIRTNYLTCINIDKSDIIWAGTDSIGVINFDGHNWGGGYIYPNLPTKNINCIGVNAGNTLFFGTYGGFVTYNPGAIYGPFGPEVLPSLVIEAIAFDNAGNWYIGTMGGLTESSILNGFRNWVTFNSEFIPDNSVTSVFYDTFGNLWVGMPFSGIAKKDNYNNWGIINNSNNNIINNYVRAFAESPSGEIWVGFGKVLLTGGGLSYYNGSAWQNVYVLPPSSQTNEILIDKNNVKWVATDQGIVRFTTSSDAVIYNYNNTGININYLTGIAQDSKGNIWISTYGGGLVEYKGNH
ncbi:MAG: two-component regulator propeller domain-containing protein [Ignavibacteriaceae bacterium]|jgi:hypothetical protein